LSNFQTSPGVAFSEIDATSGIPATSVSTGAYAGVFNWGPANQIVTISTEPQLLSTFGAPDDNTAVSFMSAANFLAYSQDLRVVRSINANGSSRNATANANASIVIDNADTYFTNYYNGVSGYGAWAARYAGTLGNSLKVSVCDSNTAYTSWAYAGQFSSAPGTSDAVSALGGSADELHLVIVDEDGAFTGTPNTVIERFSNLSKASDAQNSDGTTNYYKEVIYRTSKYVHWLAHPTNNTSGWGSATGNVVYSTQATANTVSLANGALGTVVSGNVITALDKFNNKETVDISLMFTGAGDTTVIAEGISIAESRKDIVVCVSPSLTATQNTSSGPAVAITDEFSSLTHSTYAVVDSGWKYQYDKYNDKYRWVPLNADTAGLMARTDKDRDPWFSPAGTSRGNIKNVIKLAFNPTQTDRDTLYKNGINPVVSFPGEGTILYGDKTFQNKPSAFDRINVRRLFIVLEKVISRAARSSLFEFNDEFTRAQFVNLVEPYLRTVKGRRGVYDFKVVCDTTNNTPDIIDQNQFVGDIYIKPSRSINYIQLNFIAVRSGVAFSEIVGRF